MGSLESKEKSNSSERDVRVLKKKIRHLQDEIHEVISTRESEYQAYEREIMGFVFKEAKWKRERKRLREEVKGLKKRLEERNVGMKEEDEVVGMREKSGEREWKFVGNSDGILVEQMREEKAWRDEAVEKWKKLYLEIKIELDNLIQSTHQGEGLQWKAKDEELLDQLQRELKAKEEIIEFLQARLAFMEQEELNWEREMDILRQSFRIMSHNKKATKVAKGLSKSLHV